ncbi:cytochrome C oxidase subunit II [Texcoconibacillus texcoconensis]|uniref:Cytochrome c oxidase subunit 2 n=1 Tax=Texcoconibacillus texcoconensis TaxID=1095777 RepID=A0A840QLV7_9BACI|nr:cytochrome C oxidase subunit II [Texcoconibacillus texcoconensis]MBB5172355.1 cytochrome c oxidase subunit 2 [Texcoconibacillus texcoconensis]
MKKLFSSVIFGSMLVLAACGGEEPAEEENGADNDEAVAEEEEAENSEEEAAASEIDIVATDWDFDQETYTVEEGEVTVNLINEEGHHGIVIEGTDIDIEGDGSQTAELEAGEYEIVCSIPCGEGHDDMVSTLVVE